MRLGLDLKLLTGILLLSVLSLVTLASLSKEFFLWQVLWNVLGLGLVFIFSRLDWRWLASHPLLSHSFYVLSFVLVAFTLFFAEPIRGVRGWLTVGPFHLQPSELVKAAMILVYAGFFQKRHLEASLFSNILVSFLYFLAPSILISRQPDLGTVLVLFVIWSSFLLFIGIRPKRLAIGAVIFLLVSLILWFGLLRPYQKDRIIGFIFPSIDPLGVNYNVIQSKIAVGSGGLFGKGFGLGTQSHLGFLPEAETDFLFAAFVEEWGFFGGFLLVLIFLFVVWRIGEIGKNAAGNYGKFICLGAVLVLGAQLLFNVGSNLGFYPVIGVTFPFFSYGGSSLLTLSMLVGIIHNIARQPSF